MAELGMSVRGLERVAADRREIIAAQVRCSTGFTQGRAPLGAGAVVPAAVPGLSRPVAAEDGAEDRGEPLSRGGRFARWLVAPCLAAVALALLGGPGRAAPPAVGSEDHRLMAPHAAWIQGLRRGGVSCCDMSDGRPVEARIVARPGGGSGWQVRFRPGSLAAAPVGWVDVEDGAVMPLANPVGVPIAFWAGKRVLCFVPGALF